MRRFAYGKAQRQGWTSIALTPTLVILSDPLFSFFETVFWTGIATVVYAYAGHGILTWIITKIIRRKS